MLAVFLIGILVNKNEIVCSIASVLLQYFVLSSMLWMVAQGVLMFRKLVIVFGLISTKFIVTVSLLCWCKFKLSLFFTPAFKLFYFACSLPVTLYCSSSWDLGNW